MKLLDLASGCCHGAGMAPTNASTSEQTQQIRTQVEAAAKRLKIVWDAALGDDPDYMRQAIESGNWDMIEAEGRRLGAEHDERGTAIENLKTWCGRLSTSIACDYMYSDGTL